MSTIEDKKNVVRRFHQLSTSADLTEAAKLLAPDFKGYVTGVPGTLDRVAFKQMGESFHEGFSKFQLTFASQVAEGDTVATHAIWKAVHTGTFNGIPPSGKPIEIDLFFIDRVRDGMIIEQRTNLDMIALLTQIGAMQAAA